MRKEQGLDITDRISILFNSTEIKISNAIKENQAYICSETLCTNFEFVSTNPDKKLLKYEIFVSMNKQEHKDKV
jgi:hypothetical protein